MRDPGSIAFPGHLRFLNTLYDIGYRFPVQGCEALNLERPMATYIVTYDLGEEQRAPVIEALQKYAWARLTDTSYAIVSSENPEQIFWKLARLVGKKPLFVITLQAPYFGQGSFEVQGWVEYSLAGGE